MFNFAVLAGAVASMAIGAIWFGPMFGKMWSEAMGFTPESLKEMKSDTMAKTYGLSFVFEILTAFILLQLIGMVGTTTIYGALELVFFIWIGLVIPIEAGKVIWMKKSWKLFYLNSLHRLFAYFAMATVLMLITR